MEPEKITPKQAKKYLSDWESWRAGEQDEPTRGLYWYEDEATGRYTGIDNSEGDCWTEDFETMDEVMEWLGGGQ